MRVQGWKSTCAGYQGALAMAEHSYTLHRGSGHVPHSALLPNPNSTAQGGEACVPSFFHRGALLLKLRGCAQHRSPSRSQRCMAAHHLCPLSLSSPSPTSPPISLMTALPALPPPPSLPHHCRDGDGAPPQSPPPPSPPSSPPLLPEDCPALSPRTMAETATRLPRAG